MTSASFFFMLPLASRASTIETGSTASWNSLELLHVAVLEDFNVPGGQIQVSTDLVGSRELDDRADRRRLPGAK